MSRKLSSVLAPVVLLSVLAAGAPALAAVRVPKPPTQPTPPAALPPVVNVVSANPTAPFISPVVQCNAGGVTGISRC